MHSAHIADVFIIQRLEKWHVFIVHIEKWHKRITNSINSRFLLGFNGPFGLKCAAVVRAVEREFWNRRPGKADTPAGNIFRIFPASEQFPDMRDCIE